MGAPLKQEWRNMLSRWDAIKLALRGREVMSRLIDLRYDANLPWRGAVTENEGVLLKRAVEAANELSGPVVEIGTLFGFTTNLMASWLKPGKELITVDNYSWNPWGVMPDVHRAVARRVLAPFVERNGGGVRLVDMDKNRFHAEYRGAAPAFVFIDAMHTYEETLKDIEWAKRVGATIIGGHDYCPKFEGVVRAVDEGLGREVETRDSVWVWGLRGRHVP